MKIFRIPCGIGNFPSSHSLLDDRRASNLNLGLPTQPPAEDVSQIQAFNWFLLKILQFELEYLLKTNIYVLFCWWVPCALLCGAPQGDLFQLSTHDKSKPSFKDSPLTGVTGATGIDAKCVATFFTAFVGISNENPTKYSESLTCETENYKPTKSRSL